MSRRLVFFWGIITGVVLPYAAMNFHVIRSDDGLLLLAKRPARLPETFVDFRASSMADWVAHPQLASALVQANKPHMLGDSTLDAIQESIQQLLPERPRQ